MSFEVVTPHRLFVRESLCILNLEDLSVLINPFSLACILSNGRVLF